MQRGITAGGRGTFNGEFSCSFHNHTFCSAETLIVVDSSETQEARNILTHEQYMETSYDYLFKTYTFCL